MSVVRSSVGGHVLNVGAVGCSFGNIDICHLRSDKSQTVIQNVGRMDPNLRILRFVMMSSAAVAQKYYTVNEYLDVELRTGERHQYFDGQIVPMPGGSVNHNRITANTLVSFANALLDMDYVVFTSDQKIYLPKLNFYLYPDAIVVADDPIQSIQESHAITNPLLIAEVLPPSTENYNRGQKFLEFGSLESLKEYWLIEQKRSVIVSMFRTQPNNWARTSGLDSSISARAIPGVSIPLKDIYRGVTL